jgi:hypothetical protein
MNVKVIVMSIGNQFGRQVTLGEKEEVRTVSYTRLYLLLVSGWDPIDGRGEEEGFDIESNKRFMFSLRELIKRMLTLCLASEGQDQKDCPRIRRAL